MVTGKYQPICKNILLNLIVILLNSCYYCNSKIFDVLHILRYGCQKYLLPPNDIRGGYLWRELNHLSND